MQLFEQVIPVRQASREMVRELGFLSAVFEPVGIPHSQTHALLELERAGPLEQTELAALLRIDKSTTSRIVGELVARGWAVARGSSEDRRRKRVALAAKGRVAVAGIHAEANARVQSALAVLDETQRRTVLDGLALYARALERSRRRARYAIRAIRATDDAGVAAVIRKVMPEFGASGPGFAIHDPEVDRMHATYAERRAAYFVVVELEQPGGGERVVGGGGVAPLAGAAKGTCELRKMYFLPELRGLGLGQEVLALCLEAARKKGFKRCYLETLKHMSQARALYERNGFKRLSKPEGATGHFGCDAWYSKSL